MKAACFPCCFLARYTSIGLQSVTSQKREEMVASTSVRTSHPNYMYYISLSQDFYLLTVKVFIIFQHPVTLKYSLNSIITVFNATFRTWVFTLVQHVSATLGHHQVLLLSLLKLSHCNLAFLYSHLFTFVFLQHKSTLLISILSIYKISNSTIIHF
jgi:hypothetical protein